MWGRVRIARHRVSWVEEKNMPCKGSGVCKVLFRKGPRAGTEANMKVGQAKKLVASGHVRISETEKDRDKRMNWEKQRKANEIAEAQIIAEQPDSKALGTAPHNKAVADRFVEVPLAEIEE